MSVAELRSEVAGLEVRWQVTEPRGDASTILLHGVPNSSDMWYRLLARVPGIAPDLPGFGRSAKPADFEYSIPGYDRFLESLVDELGLERFTMVMHDWGGVGLALAQRFPERVERMVIFPIVPFVPGYRWHRIARAWRTRGVGELV